MEQEKPLTSNQLALLKYGDEKYAKAHAEAWKAAFKAMNGAIEKTRDLADADFPKTPNPPTDRAARKLFKIKRKILEQEKSQREWDLLTCAKILELEEKLKDSDPERPSSAIQNGFLNAMAKQRTLEMYSSVIDALKEKRTVIIEELQRECDHPYVNLRDDGDYHRTTEWYVCASCGKSSRSRDDDASIWKNSKVIPRRF
jgi:hypothetical protein